jgi:D-glycero-D-manno-heptose 1,7-bisphosphate phosphatase
MKGPETDRDMNTEQTRLVPAVFLDRDGTIIEDQGDLSDPSQVVFFKDTIPSLRRLCARFTLFIVTNQSGVAKGTITMKGVERVNAYIESYLRGYGIRLQAIYVCPHDRLSGCRCIKPNPYFPKKAEREFGIDLGRSFVIGDHPHDVELAANAGASGIYVLSGHGTKHRHEIPKSTVVANGIREAAEIVLERMAGER